MKIYIDGQLCDEADAKISVFDHGLLYGDGVFEGIRFYNGRVFKLEEHIDRLYDSAKAICLDDPPVARRRLTDALLDDHPRQRSDATATCASSSPAASATWGSTRACARRPRSSSSPPRSSCTPRNFTRTASTSSPALRAAYLRRRCHRQSRASITSTTSWPRSRRMQANAAEALMLNDEGYIAECTADNVFLIKGGTFFTPPVSAGQPARHHSRRGARLRRRRSACPSSRPELTRYDVFMADECFLTGTAAEVVAGGAGGLARHRRRQARADHRARCLKPSAS